MRREVSILKPSVRVDRDALPSQMTPPGVSLDRQWYLYEQIRQFCDEEFQPRAQNAEAFKNPG